MLTSPHCHLTKLILRKPTSLLRWVTNITTWISQPGSGLDKCQCTMQVMFRPEGNQPKLGIIFRGKGRVTMDEKLAWHASVDVFFQQNAWLDSEVCKKWID